jgi:hypothetical protein
VTSKYWKALHWTSSTFLNAASVKNLCFDKGAEPAGKGSNPEIGITMRNTVFRGLRISKSPPAPSHAGTALHSRLTERSKQPVAISRYVTLRTFHTAWIPQQAPSPSSSSSAQPQNPHRNFYRTHGRALFKALTLAFFTYQVCYWAWLVLETEEIKDQKTREITSLEGEVRLLDEGRKNHMQGGGEKG